MIQVNRVCGHAAWKARSAASAWQVSPMAERRSRHTCCSGGLKLKVSHIEVIKAANALPLPRASCWLILPALAMRSRGARESLFDPDFWAARGELRRRSRRPRLGVVRRIRRAPVGAAALSPRRLHRATLRRSLLCGPARTECAPSPSGGLLELSDRSAACPCRSRSPPVIGAAA